jgi:thioredoxin
MKKLLVLVLFIITANCAENTSEDTTSAVTDTAQGREVQDSPDVAVTEVVNADEMEGIIAQSDDNLVIVNFYADWCGPCKQLKPIYTELAGEDETGTAFYRVDVDSHGGIARSFGVRGVPFTAFVKNREVVHALPGFNTKEAFEGVIGRFAEKKKTP